MNTRHHLALICVAALAVSACGIANDAAPRDIPLQQRSALIDAPVQAPATSTGTDRIFLLAPQLPDQPSRLRATPRDVGPSIEARLNSLFGPLSVKLLAPPEASEEETIKRKLLPLSAIPAPMEKLRLVPKIGSTCT